MSSRIMQASLPHTAPTTWQQVGKGQPISAKLRKQVVSMSKKHQMLLTGQGTAMEEHVIQLFTQVSVQVKHNHTLQNW